MRPGDVSRIPKGVSTPPIQQGPAPAYPLDRDLTVYREGSRMSFSQGKVCLDGRDVNQLLNLHVKDPSFWMGMAGSLHEYRKLVLRALRDADQLSRFDSVIDVLMRKIMGGLKKIYDQKISGLSWTLQNGQFLLNGINVRSFLALYRIRKTDKARKYLKGLKKKLALLLENPQEGPDQEGMHEIVAGIFQEVEDELATETAPHSGGRLLPPAP